jgi:hypothetical protein
VTDYYRPDDDWQNDNIRLKTPRQILKVVSGETRHRQWSQKMEQEITKEQEKVVVMSQGRIEMTKIRE